MEEEKKEVVEEVKAEEVKEEQAPAQEVDAEQNAKNGLLAFIAAVIGVVLFETAIGTLICGIIAKSLVKKVNAPIEKKPHAVFYKIAKVAAPIEIIVGIVLVVLAVIGALIALVWVILVAAGVVAAAGAAASESIAVLF